MKWAVLSVLCLVMLLYLVIGGLVFSELESTKEVKVRTGLRNKTIQFIETHSCVEREEVVDLILEVVRAFEAGVVGGELNASTESTNWDYASSVFFAGTVVTTIGYGHLSPRTSGGRTFCICYALIGIPLMLILLAGIGEKLHLAAQKIENIKFCKGSPRKGKYLKILLIITVGYPVFILIPSVIFSLFEKWTIGESIYYSMITLTTIGFGDFVAGNNGPYEYRRVYRVSLLIWTVIGLSWLSLVIGSIQDLAQCIVDKTEAIEMVSRDKSNEKGIVDDHFSENEKTVLNDGNRNSPTLVVSNGETTDCDIKL